MKTRQMRAFRAKTCNGSTKCSTAHDGSFPCCLRASSSVSSTPPSVCVASKWTPRAKSVSASSARDLQSRSCVSWPTMPSIRGNTIFMWVLHYHYLNTPILDWKARVILTKNLELFYLYRTKLQFLIFNFKNEIFYISRNTFTTTR